MQARLHVQKSSKGEMLLAFKLLVYTHWCYFSNFWWQNDWTWSSIHTVIFHLHMQINFTNLTFLHSSFKLQAWACTNAHKTSSIKQHTIGLVDETAKYESVFINRWGTSLQIVSLKTFTENFIYRDQTPR
jgi:hypothetical protein